MAAGDTSAGQRLAQVKDFLTFNKSATSIPFDPNSTKFPSRKELPDIPGAPSGAAWVWGQDDYIGRLNLLTPTRVAAAGKEIQTGEILALNLPLDVPKVPAFHREQFEHEIKTLVEGVVYDDLYRLNTQSGTQWDGFRHTHADDITGPTANQKCSIHHWSTHGIAGRGILLDYRSYAHKKGIEYDPFDYYPISYEELYHCGKAQGIDIRPQSQGGDIKIGDLLFVRSGFVEKYHTTTGDERAKAATRPHVIGPEDGQRWAGVAQEEKMLDWLHDCWFAAVAGDSPTFEAWPTHQEYHIHEYLLALWGCPIGEMFDLEKLAQKCRQHNRWTFFVSSAPANVPGGVSSHANANAIF